MLAVAHPSLLPSVIAAVSGLGGLLVAVLALFKTSAIKVNVDGRLSDTLKQVDALQAELGALREKHHDHK